MAYSHDLAGILASVTKSSKIEVTSLHDAIRAYMVDCARRGLSMRTMFNAYVDLIRFAQDIGENEPKHQPTTLNDITRDVIEAHLARLSRGEESKSRKIPSPYTVDRRRRVLKAFFNWLHAEGYIDFNPMSKLKAAPLRERMPSVWTLKQVSRFLKTFDTSDIIGHRNYVMALLALSSGLRAGELAYLRPIDVDIKTRTLSVSHRGKTGARTAVMTVQAAREVSKWMRRRKAELHLPATAPLFPRIGVSGLQVDINPHEPMRSSSISAIIAKHAKMAGIKNVKCGAHALRHTAATFLARNGASAFEIKQFLGHSSIEMSQRYVEMSNATVQRRVEQVGVLSQVSKMEQEQEHQSEDSIEKTLKEILKSR